MYTTLYTVHCVQFTVYLLDAVLLHEGSCNKSLCSKYAVLPGDFCRALPEMKNPTAILRTSLPNYFKQDFQSSILVVGLQLPNSSFSFVILYRHFCKIWHWIPPSSNTVNMLCYGCIAQII